MVKTGRLLLSCSSVPDNSLVFKLKISDYMSKPFLRASMFSFTSSSLRKSLYNNIIANQEFLKNRFGVFCIDRFKVTRISTAHADFDLLMTNHSYSIELNEFVHFKSLTNVLVV